jgi:hypothetical protein
VLVQWDPDHDPLGTPIASRAIQLGLRGETLRRYSAEAMEILDISTVVEKERAHAAFPASWDVLKTPREGPYPIGLPRTAKDSLARYGLVPADRSLAGIRALLFEESMREMTGAVRADDLALLCCVQLFSRAPLEDVPRIWDAKESGFDLACSLDVEFLVGAGLQETKKYLASLRGPAASKALAYINETQGAGQFEGFDPIEHLKNYRSYFGVNGG